MPLCSAQRPCLVFPKSLPMANTSLMNGRDIMTWGVHHSRILIHELTWRLARTPYVKKLCIKLILWTNSGRGLTKLSMVILFSPVLKTNSLQTVAEECLKNSCRWHHPPTQTLITQSLRTNPHSVCVEATPSLFLCFRFLLLCQISHFSIRL